MNFSDSRRLSNTESVEKMLAKTIQSAQKIMPNPPKLATTLAIIVTRNLCAAGTRKASELREKRFRLPTYDVLWIPWSWYSKQTNSTISVIAVDIWL